MYLSECIFAGTVARLWAYWSERGKVILSWWELTFQGL